MVVYQTKNAMNATTQIAQVLNVSPNQIKSVTEMAWVYGVVVFGRRGTFVSRKKVEAIKMTKTKWDIAVEVAALIGGNPWRGGDKVRVYLDKGYAEVGSTHLNCRALKDHNAYSAIRDAGLEAYETVTANSTATVARPAARRTTCLNCDSTGLLIGSYCTDCHGEC